MTRSITQPKAPSIIGRYAVTRGRDTLGHILELTDGSHQAVNADGELIGAYPTRIDASKAIARLQGPSA